MILKGVKRSVPQIVYGGVDGTVSTFAVIAGAYGAGLDERMTFILAAANVGADGFSMAVSAYLSARAARKRRPRWMAAVTFSAFCILGGLLIIPYAIDLAITMSRLVTFLMSCGFAITSFVIVAAIKSRVDKTTLWVSIQEVIALGTVAAAIAYFLGDGLERLIS
ncbi:VIT1/CCC1 transporter family protein [Candidatus Saccharibacteria bacterium]|nr:VIT1/CCC1 transporter family protein [Candidatus Saccharibacteria bacterium]MCB9820952.1 VIT1/CCC1 transporter family protein [Candidatus Nomurabacteria bacterium]